MIMIACKQMGPIIYPQSRPIADKSISFLAQGNVDSLKSIVHPDNWKRISPEDLTAILAAGKELISSAPSQQPLKVDSTFSEAYNLGGEVRVSTYEYIFENRKENAADTLRSIFISVAKGKVIGINVSL